MKEAAMEIFCEASAMQSALAVRAPMNQELMQQLDTIKIKAKEIASAGAEIEVVTAQRRTDAITLALELYRAVGGCVGTDGDLCVPDSHLLRLAAMGCRLSETVTSYINLRNHAVADRLRRGAAHESGRATA